MNKLVTFIRDLFPDLWKKQKKKKFLSWTVLSTQDKSSSMTVLGELQRTRQKRAAADGNNKVVKTTSVMSCRVLYYKAIWIEIYGESL